MERAGVPLLLLVAHASDDVRLPGEEGTKPAVTCAPFPDALSAFVWRNWPVVDAGRMAQAIGAEKSALEKIAREMSLPVPQPAVSPYWRRKGYTWPASLAMAERFWYYAQQQVHIHGGLI